MAQLGGELTRTLLAQTTDSLPPLLHYTTSKANMTYESK